MTKNLSIVYTIANSANGTKAKNAVLELKEYRSNGKQSACFGAKNTSLDNMD